MKRLIQVYTGKGKGKTTAAIGLALRALGHDMSVCIIQFLKKEGGTGEIKAIKKFPGVRALHAGGTFPLLRPPTEEEFKHVQQELKDALSKCKNIIESGEYDIVILDEINAAVSRGLLNLHEVLDLINSKPAHVELILTGRDATEEILDRADLITRMEEVKHPFKKGIKARKGIDY